jgi:virulence factor Mce-like protein
MRARTRTGPFSNYTLIGSAVILVATIATAISFSAGTGLPFVPRYAVTVELPDAGRLNVGAPVRVGGAQVGIVKAVHAVAPTATHPSYARADLAIEPKLAPLSVDSRVRLRPISILGGKYVSIELGTSRRKLADGRPLPLAQATKTVDIDQALRIFAPATRRSLQRTLTGFGDAFAGRGTAFGQAIGAFDHLVRPLGRVSQTLAAPSTHLARFIDAGGRLAAALAPVGPQLHGLIRHAGPSFAALRGTRGSLGELIEGTPRLEASATPALAEIEPVLADATVVSRNLGRGLRRLPGAASALDGALRAASPSLRLSPPVSIRLQALFGTLRVVAKDPSTTGSLRMLTRAVQILTPLLETVTPAQTVCNVFGLAARNLAAVRGQGDANGSFARTALYEYKPQTEQSGSPAADLHYNPYGIANASECEAGNEPYLPGQRIGSPAGRQPAQTERTAPPSSATARARAAGLLEGTR